jgi:beta-phosphoglucomutase-like phosphatase (HAD superfamily)
MLRQLDDGRRFGAVILDMDGLMLDSEIMEYRAWQRACADFGWSFSRDQHLQLLGRNHRDAEATMASWWRAAPASRGSLEQIRDRAAGYFRQAEITVKDGLPELLAWAGRERVPVAVASSSSRATIASRLRAAGVGEPIRIIAGGDEVRYGKPDPEIFLLAACRLGSDPGECVVLEDSDSGIIGAHAAGMTPFLVPDSSVPRPILPDVIGLAHRVCSSLTEVLAVLSAAPAG